MAKSENILLQLMQGMDSPDIVAGIELALEQNEREREDLLDLRKMAVRRHGKSSRESSAKSSDNTQPKTDSSPSGAESLTLNELAERYKTDPDSSFTSLAHNTREQYQALLKLILRDYGDERLSNINARTFLQWHANWSEGGKEPVAHAKIGQLRRLMSFGATMLEDSDCIKLSLYLNKLKFEAPKKRIEKMTPDQADAIRAMAHKKKRPSIALSQAFQFDLKLRQRDVIGEWVPVADRSESDLIDGDNKWVRGLRWEEIDDKLILRKQTTYGDIAFDLHMAPMVMDEFSKQYGYSGDRSKLRTSGAVILSEFGKLPWTGAEFRRWWRLLADEAGVPPEIRNSDSRKGD
jgi:hypothetical protein